MANILLLGGSGFIGKKVCEEALNRDIKITGLSRSEVPAELKKQQTNNLAWISGSVLNQALYQKELSNYGGIVHTIGILFEPKIFAFAHKLMKKPIDTTRSYETINCETALAPLRELESLAGRGLLKNQKPKPFVFLSAGAGLPFMPRYLSSKKNVENKLLEMGDSKIIRPLILRPGLIYSDHKMNILGKIFNIAYSADQLCKAKLGYKIGIPKPVKVDCVAKAIINGIVDPNVQGIFDSEKIEALANN